MSQGLALLIEQRGTVHQALEPAHVSVWLPAGNSAELGNLRCVETIQGEGAVDLGYQVR